MLFQWTEKKRNESEEKVRVGGFRSTLIKILVSNRSIDQRANLCSFFQFLFQLLLFQGATFLFDSFENVALSIEGILHVSSICDILYMNFYVEIRFFFHFVSSFFACIFCCRIEKKYAFDSIFFSPFFNGKFLISQNVFIIPDILKISSIMLPPIDVPFLCQR